MGSRSQKNKKSETTKRRILNSATEVFAEKGFAGARVEQIAQRAGVNVALLYRYFRSKENLLDAVLSRLFEKGNQVRSELTEQALPRSRKEFGELFAWALEYMAEYRNIIKIAMMEIMKNSSRAAIVYRIFDFALKDKIEAASSKPGSDTELITAAFFFGLIPLLTFLVIGESWGQHYGLSKEEIYNGFLNACGDIYAEYIVRSIESGRF